MKELFVFSDIQKYSEYSNTIVLNEEKIVYILFAYNIDMNKHLFMSGRKFIQMGLTVKETLKWNDHVDMITDKSFWCQSFK